MGPKPRKRTRVGSDPSGNTENAVIVMEDPVLVPPPVEYTQDELRHFAEALPMPTADDKKKARELVDKYKAPGNHAAARLAAKIMQSCHGETQMPWAGGAAKFLGGVSAFLFFF